MTTQIKQPKSEIEQNHLIWEAAAAEIGEVFTRDDFYTAIDLLQELTPFNPMHALSIAGHVLYKPSE